MALQIVGFVFENGKEIQLNLAECAVRELAESPSRQPSKGFVEWWVKKPTAIRNAIRERGLITQFARA